MKSKIAALLFCAISLTGCTETLSNPATCHVTSGTPVLQITLMFGLTRPDGAAVTEGQWRDFVEKIVTPRFPDGLTILPGSGQWRDRRTFAISREPSRLILIETPDRPGLSQDLATIRTTYMQQFQQQSVGISAMAACAAF